MNLPLNSALTQLNEDGELESGSDFQSFGQCISIYFCLRLLLHALKTLFLEHRLRFHQMAEGICDTHAKKKKKLLGRQEFTQIHFCRACENKLGNSK